MEMAFPYFFILLRLFTDFKVQDFVNQSIIKTSIAPLQQCLEFQPMERQIRARSSGKEGQLVPISRTDGDACTEHEMHYKKSLFHLFTPGCISAITVTNHPLSRVSIRLLLLPLHQVGLCRATDAFRCPRSRRPLYRVTGLHSLGALSMLSSVRTEDA